MVIYKLFISQPMRDKTNEQIEEERERAIKAAQNYVNAQMGIPEGERKIEVIQSFLRTLRMTQSRCGSWENLSNDSQTRTSFTL